MYRRYARTAARLTHPNIVPLHTFGEVSGLMYFVMGYVAGESLAARLRRGPLDSESGRAFISALCDALDYAHRQSIVHRDIKPNNIPIEAESGTPRLTDFGIARTMLSDTQVTTAQLAMAGQLIGTPDYMSPEQATGQPDIGAASDIYSLGMVAYETLSGRLPFDGDSPMDALAERIVHEPRPLSEIAPHLPFDLTQSTMRCLERNPAKRWPDSRSLREALIPSEDALEYSPPVRVLKVVITVAWPVVLLALVHLWVYREIHPGLQVLAPVRGLLVSTSIALLMVIVGLVVRLRREGMKLRTIARKAVEQPSWWRSWYPRSLRRPGDVWDRLPPAIRRFRMLKEALLTYVVTVFLPLPLLYSREFPRLEMPLFFLTGGGIALMYTARRAIVREITAHISMTAPEVSTLLNTPTFRASTWSRRPGVLVVTGSAQPPQQQRQ